MQLWKPKALRHGRKEPAEDTSKTFLRSQLRGRIMVRKGRHEGHWENEKNEICLFNLSLHSGRWWENLNFKVILKNLENNLDGKFLARLQRPLIPKIKRSRWTVPWRIYSSPDGNFVKHWLFYWNDETNIISTFENFPWGRKSTHTYMHTHQQSWMQVQKNSGSFSR